MAVREPNKSSHALVMEKKEAKARNRIELKTIFNKWISWGKISSKLGKRKTKKRN